MSASWRAARGSRCRCLSCGQRRACTSSRLNAMKEHGDSARIAENPALSVKCRNESLKQTQRTVSEGLQREGLPGQEVLGVYISSRGRCCSARTTPPSRDRGHHGQSLSSVTRA
jgi:hypothetical protein